MTDAPADMPPDPAAEEHFDVLNADGTEVPVTQARQLLPRSEDRNCDTHYYTVATHTKPAQHVRCAIHAF